MLGLTTAPKNAMRRVAVISLATLGACTSASLPEPSTSVSPSEASAVHRTDTSATSKPVAAPAGEAHPGTAQSTDLRRLTVLVTPTQPQAIAVKLADLGKRYARLGGLWANQGARVFGSGALLTPSTSTGDASTKSRVYVVTNRHVVGFATTVEISFPETKQDVAGRVVYVDDRYDLAIVELDDSTAPASAFALEPRPVRDQDEVIASGYPGIGGNPSYQVTRGHVSNQSVIVDETEAVPYIQHTAPIDPGSSGGPLTSAHGTLIGINTLKLRDREGVGMAVPADAITRAFTQLLTPAEPPSSAAACSHLAAMLSHQEPSQALLSAFGADLVATAGADSLAVLGRDEVWKERFVEDPTAVLTLAVAIRLWHQLKANDPKQAVHCAPQQQNSSALTLVGKGKPYPVEFTLEQGRYKLSKVTLSGRSGSGFLDSWAPTKAWKPSLR